MTGRRETSVRTCRTPRLRAVTVCALIALVAQGAVADVVAVAGRPAALGVTITDLKDAKLTYRTADGAIVTQPIETVEYLQITGWPLFNLAEKQQRDGYPAKAVNSFERVVKDLQDSTLAGRDKPPPGGEGLDRLLLARCRLLHASLKAGDFARMVEAYVDVLLSPTGGAAYLEALQPKVPAAGSPGLAAAAARVDEVIRKHASDAIGLGLSQWRSTWPSIASEAPAEAGTAVATPSVDLARAEAVAGQIRHLVENRRYDEAIAAAQRVRRQLTGHAAAAVWYWRARAHIGRAASPGADHVAELNRAGLALLRVALQYPSSSLAPEALYTAAELCDQTGQSQQATTLWSELVSTYPTAMPWVAQARQKLATRPASAPAP